ncbi:MAG: hypothetical protein ABIJ47_05680 [Candidatus Bathyarchaeota archaeon]
MNPLGQIKEALVKALDHVWGRALHRMIGGDMLTLTLLMMDIREIREVEGEDQAGN